MHWYIVHAYSGFEKHVQASLKERIAHMDMVSSFGEIMVPVEEVVEMRNGQKRRSERKFFPGYLLVEMEMNDDSWQLVNNTPKVMGFIGGTRAKPAPISQQEVDRILQRIEAGVSKPKPKVIYEPGEVVRVTDGPFSDFSAVVQDVDYDKSRLKVDVSIFGRSTPVDLEFGQVEKS